MFSKRNGKRAKRNRESGAILVFVTIALAALVGLAAWSTETGRAWQTKSQLQAAADAAALAGVGSLLSADFSSVDEAAARAAAIAYGGEHEALGATLAIASADVQAGSWNMASRTFTPLPGNTDPNQMRAVRVVARRDDVANGPIDTIFGRVLGIDSIPVNTDAVAHWGWAGSGGPGVADLPIAIDCCAVAGPGCTQDYCETVSNTVPNPCLLSNGETTSCLEFFSTPEQNACWTVFDGDSPTVSVPLMTDIVANGNPDDIGTEPIYLDNGTKTPVVQDIKDKFDAEGTDTNGDGVVDSWVVSLPVVECQNPGDQCASGNTQYIVGFLCMDIREVIVTPDKLIKGDFICSSDPRCDTPGFGAGGSLIGSISAAYPVIVD
ncbi:MAG TPA: pilus assembly protein TadG-related protein [Myxococcota bacterium]|nr:pilus assembly protein TadG-related protein [Myxococcota bacterium]